MSDASSSASVPRDRGTAPGGVASHPGGTVTVFKRLDEAMKTGCFVDGVKYFEFVGVGISPSSIATFERAVNARVNGREFAIAGESEEVYEQIWVPMQLDLTGEKARLLKNITTPSTAAHEKIVMELTGKNIDTCLEYYIRGIGFVLYEAGCTKEHVNQLVAKYETFDWGNGIKSAIHCVYVPDDEKPDPAGADLPPWSIAITLSASLVAKGAVELIIKRASDVLDSLIISK
jgi:hypothetical protein